MSGYRGHKIKALGVAVNRLCQQMARQGRGGNAVSGKALCIPKALSETAKIGHTIHRDAYGATPSVVDLHIL